MGRKETGVFYTGISKCEQYLLNFTVALLPDG